jgi:hypothetical protein
MSGTRLGLEKKIMLDKRRSIPSRVLVVEREPSRVLVTEQSRDVYLTLPVYLA